MRANGRNVPASILTEEVLEETCRRGGGGETQAAWGT